MKAHLLAGIACAAVMSVPLAVQAQTVAAPVSGDIAAHAAADADTGEVIVTAQRRAENVQKIPVAVAVIGGAALEHANVTSLADITRFVPSVSFSAGNELRNNSIRIRGIGTDVFSTGVESSVSTVLDGVVLQRPGAAFSDLGDVERIEVLRGPQGTLFGKNSSAGVINIITRGPDFDTFEGTVQGLVAENNEYRLNAAVGGPIATDVGFRLAAFYRTQDGISDNLYDDKDINGSSAYGARLKLGINPTSNLKIMLEGDYSKIHADCCGLPLRVASNDPRALPTKTNVGPDNRDVNNDLNPYVHQTNWGGAATIDWSLGEYTLTSITAYRKFLNLSDEDLDDTQTQFMPSNFNIERSHTTTEEIRLTSPRGKLFDYVLGAYYFNGSAYNFLDRHGLNIGAVQTINPDGTIIPKVPGLGELTGESTVNDNNKSVFGQANLHFGALTLTGGLRYLDEHQELLFLRPIAGLFNGANQPATNPALGPLDGHYRDSAMIGKASATYEFSNAITGYVSYSTGYKSEGLAATLGLSAAQFANEPAPAETSKLWEAGLKTSLIDHKLMLNVTLFRTRFKNYQGQTYNPAAGLVVLTSVGGVRDDGVEVEFNAHPIAGLTINGGVTYLDARFGDVPNGPCFTGQTAAQGCAPNAQGAAVQSLNGKPFVNAPKWHYDLSARYEMPGEGVRPYVQGDWSWQTKAVFDLTQNPNMIQSSYGVFNAAAGVALDHGKYEVGGFVKNLFNKHYVAGIMAVSSAGGANAYAQQLPRDFDRYAGLSFRANF
jgi:iron complex outermembrane receptor protein